jgi:two-component sensor histidine kinase
LKSQGPEAEIAADKALLLSMILHELGTNAVKYGALSNETGTVDVIWSLADQEGKGQVELEWRELGGPDVAPPTRRGFGSTLISRALNADNGKSEIAYLPTGVVCRVSITLK